MANLIKRSRPSRTSDGATDFSLRHSGYGEPYSMPFSSRVAADEGSYRILRNATAGTGVAGHAAPTTMDNTKPFILLQNGSTDARIYLDYIRLYVTAAGTAGTLNYATHLLDPGAGYTSGGEDLTPVNPNGEFGAVSALTQYKNGAVVATAGGAQRIVSTTAVRTVIPVVGDNILFTFEGLTRAGAGMPLEGTLQLEKIIQCPPIIIAPTWFYKLVLWRASQTAAASYETEIGFWER